MKKGIVMEKHRRYTVVMRKDGAFQKARPIKHAGIGTEVSYQPIDGKRRPLFHDMTGKKPILFQLTAAACLLLLLIPIYMVMDDGKTYAFINITINPNFELEIDDDLQVQSITPLNDDAEAVLHELTDYKGDQLENVIQQIITESEEANLLENGKNMLVGVSYMPDAHEFSVSNAIDKYFLDYDSEWAITTFQVPKKIRREAQENKESMNELMATNLTESEAVDDTESKDTAEDPIDDDDREMIDSFYNDDDSHSGEAADKKQSEKSEDNMSYEEKDSHENDLHGKPAELIGKEKPANSSETEHPSELKVKNGETNGHEHNKVEKASGVNKAKNEKEDNERRTERNRSKASGHDKSQGHNGKAKGHKKAKDNNGKAKGHGQAKEDNKKDKRHEKTKDNNGKAKGHEKTEGNNVKAKQH